MSVERLTSVLSGATYIEHCLPAGLGSYLQIWPTDGIDVNSMFFYVFNIFYAYLILFIFILEQFVVFSYKSNCMIFRLGATSIPKPWLALSASSPRAPRATIAKCPRASSAKDEYGFTWTVFHTVEVFS